MTEAREAPRSLTLRAMWTQLGPFLALGILVAYAAWREPLFLAPENLLNILKQWSWVGICAMGMTLVITAGGIDLSVGSLMAFLGALGIIVLNSLLSADVIANGQIPDELRHSPLGLVHSVAFVGRLFGGQEWVAVAIAMLTMGLVGTFAGWIHGILIARGKLAPFVATLGGLAAYRSLALSLASGGELRSQSQDAFAILGQGGIPIPGTDLNARTPTIEPLLFPWPILVWVACATLAWIVLNRLRVGRHILAVGGNERAALHAGISVARVKTWTYAALGFATGISAIVLSSRLNAISTSSTGILFELDVIAAVVIGGTSLRGGYGTVLGTLAGVLILATIENLLLMSQVSPYLHGCVKGAVIVLAALVQRSPSRNVA